MGVEKGMVGDVPESGLVLGTVPDRVRTSEDGLFEHFQGGLILGNDALGPFHRNLHSACLLFRDFERRLLIFLTVNAIPFSEPFAIRMHLCLSSGKAQKSCNLVNPV